METKVSKLVVLPCHSIWLGDGIGETRKEWALVDFQIEGHDHLCFKDHIEKSLQFLNDNRDSYLVISGGQTKQDCGPISEAYSYFRLAKKLYPEFDFARVTTEEFARDSFENVLFLICRFFEVHGYYPESIAVVGFEFKRDRFVNLHLQQALKFPAKKIEYIGNLPLPVDMDELQLQSYFLDLNHSEFKFAVAPFREDLYGNQTFLKKKKSGRNPFNRHHGYHRSNEQLVRFLTAIDAGDEKDVSRYLENMPWIQ